ncbi:MAG: type II toxin-antitoxin system VapC family toxin [Proteobacteria bacterium]|nr:type II toxin-antitoxin system VapC family toxin [Pseudomonadota bacterium]
MKIEGSGVYVDTSALVKLYVPERWSTELDTALSGRRDLLVSELAVTELTSATIRRVREGELSAVHGRRVYQRLQRDLDDGQFRRVELTASAHREAERLLLGLGRRSALRAADALHLALAALLGARVMLTFDEHMRRAAEALGTLEVPVP